MKRKPPSDSTLAARLTFAEKSAEAWRENAGRERARNAALEERIRLLYETVVQLAHRLGAYGDPDSGTTMSVSAPTESR